MSDPIVHFAALLIIGCFTAACINRIGIEVIGKILLTVVLAIMSLVILAAPKDGVLIHVLECVILLPLLGMVLWAIFWGTFRGWKEQRATTLKKATQPPPPEPDDPSLLFREVHSEDDSHQRVAKAFGRPY